MPIEVTPRAIAVLKRALELGRMDPSRVGIRISTARGLHGNEARTGFSEEPEADEVTVVAGDLRLFVPSALAERGAVVDVADEHDKIVVR
jgi:hypothetical protein